MGQKCLPSEIKSLLQKSKVIQASHLNVLFHDSFLTVFLLLGDRGRPSHLNICTATQYLSFSAKYFIGFRKREIHLWQISHKVKLKVFCSYPLSSGLPIQVCSFMMGI